MRTPISIAAILLSVFFFTGCNRSATPEAKAPPPSPAVAAATITASPNPVAISAEVGTTTITWNTGDGTDGTVYVSFEGGPDGLFHEAPSGSAEAPWIQAGKTYEFRLYAGTEHTKLLAKTQVKGQK